MTPDETDTRADTETPGTPSADAGSETEDPGAVLRTARLVIRPWRTEESDRLFDLYRRWEVSRWLGTTESAMSTRAEAGRRIERWRTAYTGRHGVGTWAVERAADGVVVGTVAVVELPDSHGDLEVAWHLHPDSWRMGYATEAARAVLDRALAEDDVDEIYAVVRPGNNASVAVCQRLGMTSLGRTSRFYGATMELYTTLR